VFIALKPWRIALKHLKHNSEGAAAVGAIVVREAGSGAPSPLEVSERMARRRFQDPKPKRRGSWWIIQVRRDVFVDGKPQRKNRWEKLAPAETSEREALKLAAEHVRPINQGLETIGGATNFRQYVESTYIPVALSGMASTTQNRYQGVINNYLVPAFGKLSLLQVTPATLDHYFAALAAQGKLTQESLDKVRDVLASIVKRAIRHGLLIKNPFDNLEMPRSRVRQSRSKPYIKPEQFDALLAKIAEPYATMLYVAVYTGLRVSELTGLRWNDIHDETITVDERYCRGDWDVPKSEASNATIAVNRDVIQRIRSLKLLSVSVRWGGHGARKTIKAVRSCNSSDLVFQSLKKGAPMRDNNILSRHIKPAARELGIDWVNWRCLRRSHATWLKMAGADVKDAQAQMRHSRASTTLDIYQQFTPESQRLAVDRLMTLPRPRPQMVN
jgi:integrase